VGDDDQLAVVVIRASFPGEEPLEQLRDCLRVRWIPRLFRDCVASPDRVPDRLDDVERLVHDLPDQAEFAPPDEDAIGRR
jgi:hypothetical protein